MSMTSQQQQSIPVQIHQAADLLVLAAPMPGMEPADISVRIHGERVVIRGDYRGSRHDLPEVLISEWTIGPYYREVVLPEAVNGALTNATYGNGVLVLSMPRLASERQGGPAEFRLEAVTDTRGQYINHIGSALEPTTTKTRKRQKTRTTRQSET